MAPRVLAVIPARLNSKRFPNKVIHPFRGQPLLSYVYREICRAKLIDRVIVATDSREVHDVMSRIGADVMLTSKRHQTGSDRVAEAMRKLGGQIIINVQADNFGLKASVLDRVIGKMRRNRRIRFATLARRIASPDELSSPHTVKVVVSREDDALWFSRWPIPYLQHPKGRKPTSQFTYLAHVGVYFFRRRALEQFAAWPRSPLEKVESLEQLRILEHGEGIKVFKTSLRCVSVDTPRDVAKLEAVYR
ncbi:MAG: 3-deoxy-manno-octulosonate cytidylyltransferase [Candidatus Zixiibacteriota bacterium]